ncbi:MAG: metallophosphoesterase [Thermomicrobium sp.]|nr:metallophosphoesterase [Thermomicrobium sp.]
MFDRERFARRLIALGASAGLAALLTAALEPYRLRIKHVRLSLPRGCDAIAGLRVAFLTDFHVGGPGPSSRTTIAALERIRTWRPHLVLLGGDYFDQGRWFETAAFDKLRGLGHVYAVLGNHDYRRGVDTAAMIVRFLETHDVRVLRNQLVIVRPADFPGQVELLGLDDPYSGLHDARLACTPPGPSPRILLAHAPSVLDELPIGSADLALFGHTHWGQVRLSWSRHLNPLDAAWYLDKVRRKAHAQFQRGWFWTKGMLVYVSTGIGQTQLPLRLFAPPEAVLLEFDPAARDPRWPCDDPRYYVREAILDRTEGPR